MINIQLLPVDSDGLKFSSIKRMLQKELPENNSPLPIRNQNKLDKHDLLHLYLQQKAGKGKIVPEIE